MKIHKFNITFLLFDSISSFSFIIFGLFQKYRFMYCFLRSLYKTHSNNKNEIHLLIYYKYDISSDLLVFYLVEPIYLSQSLVYVKIILIY